MRVGAVIGAWIVLIAMSASAVADDAPPWAKGVSDEQLRAAKAEYELGNEAYGSLRYTEALAAYERALQFWDNPAIQYNASICLAHLGRILEAYDRLVRSLAYGAEPFNGDLYQQALLQQKLLRAQIAEVAIDVSEPGANITIDGGSIAAGASRLLLAGQHQIAISKDGFLTQTKIVDLRGGSSARLPFTLARPGVGVVTRRWQWWIPWTVFGVGAITAATGSLFHVASVREFDRYDEEFRIKCPTGCAGEPISVAPIRERAELQRAIAISGYALGGVAIVTGIALVVLNRERVVEARPIVTSSQGGVGLAIEGRF